MSEAEENQVAEPEVVEEAQVEEKAEEKVEEKPQEEEKKTIDDRVAEIKKQTYLKHEAIRKEQELKRQNAEMLEKIEKARERDLVEPSPDDYEDTAEYIADLKSHAAKKTQVEAERLAREKFNEQQNQQRFDKTITKYQVKREIAEEKDPNYGTYDVKVNRVLTAYGALPLGQTIIESDKATDIVTYLGKNVEELDRIAQLPPAGALKEIGILEYKLSQKPEKKLANAPDPIEPVHGDVSAPKDLSRMSQKDYEALKNKEQFGY